MHDERRSKSDGRDKAGVRRAREIFIDCSATAISRPGPGRRSRSAIMPASMLYPSMMFRLNGIDPERRRGLAYDPGADGTSRSAGTHRFSPQGCDRPAAAPRNRMAGDFYPTGAGGRHRGHGLEPDDLTRGEIDGPARRSRRSNSCARCPALKNPTSSTCRPNSASAKPGACGGYMLSGEDRTGLRLVRRLHRLVEPTWPGESHVAGDVIFNSPPIPQSRGFNELPIACWSPEAVDNS